MATRDRKSTRDPEGSIIKKIEERRTANGRTKKVPVYYARVRYTDGQGVRKEKKRRAQSFDDAVIQRRRLREEISNERFTSSDEKQKPKYFREVLDYYVANYVKPAEYAGNHKVAGLREPIAYIERHIELFRKEFGDKLADRITHDDLKEFKARRLAVPVTIEYQERIAIQDGRGKKKYRLEKKEKTRPRAIASVHRELERLRRIFNIAVRKGWLDQNPFRKGDPLVLHSVENHRVRILSFAEEKRLLAACAGRREHLRPILVSALDTCLRKNELFTLLWGDVDLNKRTICVRALNTKTLRTRIVPISERLFAELLQLREMTHVDDASPVFGISSPKKAFYGALADAKITDLRFHDLRGTGITRLLRAGMPATEVMKISGHTQWSTFMRYVKVDDDTISRAKTALDNYLEASELGVGGTARGNEKRRTASIHLFPNK